MAHKKSLMLILLIFSCLATPFFLHNFFLHKWLHAKSLTPSSCKSHVSDSWYPTQKDTLLSLLDSLDAQAKQRFSADISSKNIRAIIVPHASYYFSGDVAAAAYRLLPSSIRRVILLTPSHSSAFSGITLPTCTTYQLPIGSIPIDTQALTQLAKHPLFTYNNSVYLEEHSLEIQLPILYYYLPNATIVPLMVGTLSVNQIYEIADTLSHLIDATTAVIVSSDFTHYGPRFKYEPFADNQQLRIKQLDSGAIQAIQKSSVHQYISYIERTGATICGRMPIAILMALLEKNLFGPIETHLLAYKTSSNQTNTAADSVSYTSLVFSTKKNISPTPKELLTDYEKSELLTVARSALENIFTHKTPEQLLYPILTNANTTPCGAFVTLYKHGVLRGCIGRTVSDEPLYKTIIAMTKAAAQEDSRFKPVTHDELTDITISISVLTQPKNVTSYHDISIGTHGIILKNGSHSAVFLPKVATEFKWDLPKTLSELSIKAGLPSDAWQNKDTLYSVFESIDFAGKK
ncbi:MAG: AmmeMemoRadiSam system protein B [Candidatus Dependentiae bacterium]|nr:AmmeMemoRadiSam system protein B [Candidatus Dependentiae bacterium]